ncbi:Flavin-containing monooxygenase [Caenorhabditis elegans]|uniref:Flavin-containing monooxygenase n=1 Tax=Caenorhabditis elegans TaxID=6239 RepID=Q17585_CAEEL|nr:Flavin-containing monooxygenase [Caenorhabditis elegans]CAA95783.3 Flavin-containing monooxygenase [Caenorhabditis elegans]|eukprot:NP_492038.3 Flavin-containing monooxygenase [Caenorhabditis elegans]
MHKKICIIGAGAAGLVSAKHAIKQGYQVDIFEQTDQVGGTWVYSEKTGCHSSLYKVMKTNLPKEAMLFQDEPFRDELPSFMSHEHVLEYLNEFSKDFPIQFSSTVNEVKRENDLWKVLIESNSETITRFYDVVFVCNGHFFEPLNPYQNSYFKGKLIHSHDYRRAEHYTGKNVVIVGAGPSGIDITLQIAQTANHVTLISKKATYPVLPESVQQMATNVKSVDEHGVVTDEGDHVPADVIIVCTGYVFKFPFLDSSLIQLKYNDRMVSPLYEHLCHVDYPTTLFFIGLPLGTITFPLFEVQVKYALSLIAGKGKLPSDDVEIRNFEDARLQGLLNPASFHVIIEEQWEYMKKLAKMGGFEEWNYMETIKKLYGYIMTERKKNVIGYKMVNFELTTDSSDFKVVDI